jgi:hypothetical protein
LEEITKQRGRIVSHHSHDNAHIKQVLIDVISIAMSHIHDIALKLKELNITAENLDQKSEQDKHKSMTLNNILNILNDAMHPAHHLVKDFFPGAEKFAELCMQNHKIAIERKLISATCHCYMCKIEKPTA